MIISHKNKFIFLHGQKTAGSSVTAALNRSLGPRDIQVGAWEDTLENDGKINIQTAKVLSLRLPKLLALSIKETINTRHPVSKFDKKTMNGLISGWYKRKAGFFPEPAHATATQVQQYDPKAWDDYFKFSIVRNPWDHAVSYYYWNTRKVNFVSL